MLGRIRRHRGRSDNDSRQGRAVGASFVTDDNAVPIHVLDAGGLRDWMVGAEAAARAWVGASRFTGALGQVQPIPDARGGLSAVLFGWGSEADRRRSRLHFGTLPGLLPAGSYRLAGDCGDAEEAALGWLLGSYRFDRYRPRTDPPALAGLVAPEGVDAPRLEAIADACALTCDLINTPANDMGPEALEAAFAAVAGAHGADWSAVRGADLLAGNFPMIHAVGRASDQAPRLLDMRWGDAGHPRVTIAGTGVCFDTGGLNRKPGKSMGLMKKDMGGAATALGLAQMIMALRLPVRLRVLVPAVENAVSGGSFRPGDILTSRKGLTVEVNNTDAEGRLVLADALALAAEEAPDLLVSLATLTGAARVALGPDIPPFYTDAEDWAAAIGMAADRVADPLWRMPFWDPYERLIEPGIADLDNAPTGGMAGSITAALFLRRFAEGAGAFAHLDIYGWTPDNRPGRPKGGACQGARALLAAIEARYGGA